MSIVATAVIGPVGLLHIVSLLLEMLFWTKPARLRALSQTRTAAEASKVPAGDGAPTVSCKIFFVQGLPAAIGLALLLIG